MVSEHPVNVTWRELLATDAPLAAERPVLLADEQEHAVALETLELLCGGEAGFGRTALREMFEKGAALPSGALAETVLRYREESRG